MKALVTGGAGFIGTHLLEYFANTGIAARIFDTNIINQHFNFDFSAWDKTIGNIENYSEVLLAANDCEVIFHLASALGTDFLVYRPQLAVQTNITGTLNVLNAAKQTGALVVYLSLLPDWNNSYMITKNAAAKFCQMYFQEFGVKTVVLRGSHIYGERQKWAPVQKAVPNFILSALKNEALKIFGSGEQLMDLLYVKDAVQAIAHAANIPDAIGQTIELGSGIGISVSELARKIIELCNSSATLDFIEHRIGEPNSPAAFVPANTQQQSNILGFTPHTNLEVGLLQTIKWYREIALAKGGENASF
jgi:UDP-glucose 4-epimerase